MFPWKLTRTLWTGCGQSQEGGVTEVGKDGEEVAVCAWYQHTGREGVLVDGVAPEQGESEHVRVDFVHAKCLYDRWNIGG